MNAFEKEMAMYSETADVAVLSSGTTAILLALELIGVGQEDKVFCSSLTFVASANLIMYLSANPVFIDSEEETWNMSQEALKRAFEEAQNS